VRTRALWLAGFGFMASWGAGCGEPETKQVAPTPPDPLADVPADVDPTLDDGNWSIDQRGIAIDAEDFAVIQQEESPAGISIGQLTTRFGYLVLNLPALDYLRGGAGANDCAATGVTAACVDPENAEEARPLATAVALLDRLSSQKSLTFDQIAVNIDLMDATHKRLLHLCGGDPFFGDLGYRQSIVETFVELADLPNLKYITVGAELNRYTYFRNGADEPIPEDYVNLVTLYREIYAAVKAKNPDVKVGPGFSWDFFMNTSVPTVAGEFDLTDTTSFPAVYRTWQRTIYPFLIEAGDPGQFPKALSADFVGFTVAPDIEADPFGGDPAPSDEEDAAAVDRYFRYLSRMGDLKLGGAGPLPIAFTQVDWPIKSAGFGNQKGPFLETFKRAVSHVDVAYAAWRRLSDLPTMVQGQVSPCDRVMESYCQAKEFCNGGLITSSGNVRDTLEIFTTDP
jgi:hypothetical protein